MKMKAIAWLGWFGVLMSSGTAVAQPDTVAEQMQWFKDAKFGMFIHFQAPRSGEFNPGDFDAAEWVRIAKAGGMKYMTLTTSQSSHIPLWNSSVSEQDVTDRTSWKRDIVKELAEACQAEGIRMGCYYPIADPYNPLYNEPDVGGEIRPYVEYLHSVIKEVCENYGPCLIWFDASRRFRDPAEKPLLRQQDMVDTYNATIHDVEYVPGKPTKAIDMKMFTVPDRRPLLPGEITEPWDYQMYRKQGEGVMPARAITVSGLQTKGQALSWDFKIFKPGTFEIVIDCRGVGRQSQGVEGKLRAHVAGQSVENGLTFGSPGEARFGRVQIEAPGTYTFTLEVASDFRKAPRYRCVTLVPSSGEQ